MSTMKQNNGRFTSDTTSSDGEKVSRVPFVELLRILSRHPLLCYDGNG